MRRRGVIPVFFDLVHREDVRMIKFEHVSKIYSNGVKGLDDVNLQIEQGEFVAIIGLSGAGKSTLIRTINRMIDITDGKLEVDGTDVSSLKGKTLRRFRRKIGMIFQSFNLVSSINVWENIVLPIGLDGRKVDEKFVMDIVSTLGLEKKLHNLPNTLSGGQQQRVAIARALASKPDILFADEPTGNLDSRTSDEVIALLKMSVRKYGQTLVMITHDEDIAQIADRILVIEDGKVAELR